ncbi:MAG TPA: DUF3899 domain-containing protein [Clostridia bacterium]
MKNKILKYVITFSIGGCFSFLAFFRQNLFEKSNLLDIFEILSNGFLLAGIIIFGLGSLIFVSNEGAFDIFVFGFKNFFSLFNREKRETRQTYFEYRQERSNKKTSFLFLLFVGGFYLLLSALFVILFFIYS